MSANRKVLAFVSRLNADKAYQNLLQVSRCLITKLAHDISNVEARLPWDALKVDLKGTMKGELLSMSLFLRGLFNASLELVLLSFPESWSQIN